jgi:hypothetical protein
MRPILAAFAVVATAVVWSGPEPARADLAEGEKAVAFEGKEFVNSAKCDLKSLRGRVILYEIFRTW